MTQVINSTNDQEALATRIASILSSVWGQAPVSLHEPRFVGNERAYTSACIDSSFVSSVGAYVDQFEYVLAKFTNAKHAIAVVNGTAALHISLLLAGVQPNDEVLLPALTFVATANAVHYCNAIPHLVDSNFDTLGMDPEALRSWLNHSCEIRAGLCVNRHTGRVVRALVPMHTFGHPCDMQGLLKIARDFNLAVVEDATESLGSIYQGQHTGTLGLFGTLSFNGNKIITTGGGGAILTNDTALARRAKHITTTAKLPHRWDFVHDEIGYNYRMPNLNAALGCAQLEQLPNFIQSKRKLFEKYSAAFERVSEVSIVAEPKGSESNYWLQTLLLSLDKFDERDSILTATNNAGFMTRPVWKLMHHLKSYQNCPRAPLPVAESLEQRLINIPSSVILS